MALLAQFLGNEAVASMSKEQIERTCDLLHAEMLRNALTNRSSKEELTRLAQTVASKAAMISQR